MMITRILIFSFLSVVGYYNKCHYLGYRSPVILTRDNSQFLLHSCPRMYVCKWYVTGQNSPSYHLTFKPHSIIILYSSRAFALFFKRPCPFPERICWFVSRLNPWWTTFFPFSIFVQFHHCSNLYSLFDAAQCEWRNCFWGKRGSRSLLESKTILNFARSFSKTSLLLPSNIQS